MDVEGYDFLNPLHKAASNGRTDFVSLLLEFDVNVLTEVVGSIHGQLCSVSLMSILILTL